MKDDSLVALTLERRDDVWTDESGGANQQYAHAASVARAERNGFSAASRLRRTRARARRPSSLLSSSPRPETRSAEPGTLKGSSRDSGTEAASMDHRGARR